jgi:hypothetical protein
MRHRTHDHLFAAAGVTAALSLIGTGVTVLKGSVLEFSAWPVVGHDQPRRVTLPVAPVVLAPNGGTSSRVAAIDGTSGGNAFPGLSGVTRGNSPISTLDFNLPAPVIVPRNGGTAGPGSTGSGRTQSTRDVSLAVQGGAGSLGVFSSASDGNHNAPGATPTATPADPRTTDKDADGVPDSWATDTGTPSTVTDVVSDASGRDSVAPSFVAEDPGTDPSAGTPAPTETTPTTPAEPAPVPADPAPTTDKTPSNPSPAPTPADPTPPTDTTTSTPTPTAPSNPTPPPADTDDSDSDSDSDPAPSQPAPPADPAPSQAPADPAPPAHTDDDGDDCAPAAPAAPAAEANAAVPQSAQ